MNKDSQKSNDLKSLIAQPKRLSCIDQVSLNLEDILAAREKKVTWQAIADTLDLQRPTLINAVKTLTTKSHQTLASHENHGYSQNTQKTYSPAPNTKQSNNTQNTSIREPTKPQQRTLNGIKTIGRSKLEDFNLDT
ncbi:hypothetical protein [methanotrophic endosymbiont of Bathymodiolus puteoserpentis (Logatchev)]|uniref:hypothetical protein n=1 Tax=methanotrophic endosymbiont of Bathymodiolus puteoserpentis (Logatchev) TaxID=343235 RepID=UPI00157B6083|nr:hypothetical protein [methanotrophic endosymbiont of Bathymodiolus puteoserpentis (Logatchev)]